MSTEIGPTTVLPSDVIHDLSILLNSELTIKSTSAAWSVSSFDHLRQLRQVQTSYGLGHHETAGLCLPLDYCNAVLYGLPQSSISSIYSTCSVGHTWPHNHVCLVLKELHWLPVIHWIQYQVALLMFTVHSNHCLLYPRNLLHLWAVIHLVNIFIILPRAHCNSSCSLDRSILYGAILNATLRTAGALDFFWIGLKRRTTRASHVTKMDY